MLLCQEEVKVNLVMGYRLHFYIALLYLVTTGFSNNY